jgi:hypothetical protein
LSTYRIGIFHNLQSAQATPFNISDNTSTTADYSTWSLPGAGSQPFTSNTNVGISFTSIQSSVNPIVNNNTATGCNYGVQFWNIPTTTGMTYNAGTISNSVTAGVGIFNVSSSFGNATGNATINIQNSTLTDNAVGILVIDDASNTNVSGLILNAHNNFISGGTNAIKLVGQDISATIHTNSITGQSVALNGSSYTGSTPVAATCNWWGTTDPSAVAAKITGSADYIPYLSSGTDTDTGTAGFQTTEVCSACNLSVTLASKTNVTCNGASDGTIDINVSGSQTPYTYVWTKNNVAFAPTTQDLTGLAPGVYKVTVTGSDGCSGVSGDITIGSNLISSCHQCIM